MLIPNNRQQRADHKAITIDSRSSHLFSFNWGVRITADQTQRHRRTSCCFAPFLFSDSSPQSRNFSLQSFHQTFTLLHVPAGFLSNTMHRERLSEAAGRWNTQFQTDLPVPHLQLRLQSLIHLIDLVDFSQQPVRGEELGPAAADRQSYSSRKTGEM